MSASKKPISIIERWDAAIASKQANAEKKGNPAPVNKPADSNRADAYLTSEKELISSSPVTPADELPPSTGSDPTRYSINYNASYSLPRKPRKPRKTKPPVGSIPQEVAKKNQPSAEESGVHSAATSVRPSEPHVRKDTQRKHDTGDHRIGAETAGQGRAKASVSELVNKDQQHATASNTDVDEQILRERSTRPKSTGEQPQKSAVQQKPETGNKSNDDDQRGEGQQETGNVKQDVNLPTFPKLMAVATAGNRLPDRNSKSPFSGGGFGRKSRATPVFAENVDPEPRPKKKSGYGSSIVIGFVLLLVGFGGFGTWSALAPLRSGAMAPGVVKLAGERKTVQHLEGGIIKDILIKEGDTVEAGQVLIRLDGNRAEASLDALSAEYYALLARNARLQSERRDANDIVIPDDLLTVISDSDVKDLIQGERDKLTSRRASVEDQLDVFDSWQKTYEQEITGLLAQRTAAKQQLVHIKDELDAVEKLFKKGLISKPRLLELKRTAAGLTGKVGALTADISRAEQKIGEAKLRGIALETQQQSEVSDELQEVQTRILTLKEQLRAASDIVKRLEITAPHSGRIVDLRYYTPGGVITPSTPILDIVPGDDKLIVEADVQPVDIDIVVPGSEAQIQLTAYSMRKTPPLAGKVLQVSADRIVDPKSGEFSYKAQVEIDPEALQKLENVKLYPGMPASVQIVTGERTALDYLLGPIQSGLRKTWLED